MNCELIKYVIEALINEAEGKCLTDSNGEALDAQSVSLVKEEAIEYVRNIE